MNWVFHQELKNFHITRREFTSLQQVFLTSQKLLVLAKMLAQIALVYIKKKKKKKKKNNWTPKEKVVPSWVAVKMNNKRGHLYSDLDSLSLTPLYLASVSYGKNMLMIAPACILQREGELKPHPSTPPSPQRHSLIFFPLNSFPSAFPLGHSLTFSLPPIWFKQCSNILCNPRLRMCFGALSFNFFKCFLFHKTVLVHYLWV